MWGTGNQPEAIALPEIRSLMNRVTVMEDSVFTGKYLFSAVRTADLGDSGMPSASMMESYFAIIQAYPCYRSNTFGMMYSGNRLGVVLRSRRNSFAGFVRGISLQ